MRAILAPLVAAILGGWGLTAPAAADDHFGDLPAGPGREAVADFCAACHSLRLVVQQRVTRDDWDETLVWMAEEQGIPRLDPDERKRVLDYLGVYLGRDVPR